ncbi:hypothetical protein E2R51_12140 [Jeotgalibacillus sp. S-D1]|uniref:hypothetical protein n=1 Tax=Jeotgalibacillus sp. S-D1 TaxID=2552189 RepID=UPI001059D16E|nr:hypothetical protein [Jeotgalibacillus sp. S-D1]TDL31959.1 hypothetical protein E2R51_12140 [Jeotgalibacillus sp. S-D1]
MELNLESNARIRDLLRSKVGDRIGVITSNGAFITGFIAKVKGNILTLATAVTHVQGRRRFAAVAFISIDDIIAIVFDPEQLIDPE